MINKSNWEETKNNFDLWWQDRDIGRPLMNIIAKEDQSLFVEPYQTLENKYLGVDYLLNSTLHNINRSTYYADAYPSIDINIGPGSLAVYLGSKPIFTNDTVWFEPCIKSYDTFNIELNEKNYWLNKHLEIVKQIKLKAQNDFVVNIPDIVENIDILAAMRDPQTLLYDIMDSPEIVKKFINDIEACYFKVYDKFFDIVKDDNGWSGFTAFNIYGKGKTAKVQCDFSAMLSTNHFREFVKPNLEKQCNLLDNSIYHLDGTDCIHHVPSLMEIESLNALQWTPGATQPDGANKRWYPIYEQAQKAGKSMFVYIYDGNFDDWIDSSQNFIKKFGRIGVYFLYPVMSNEQARKLVDISYRW